MNTQKLIKHLIEYAKTTINDVTIIFLANVKNITPNDDDYLDSSILTEFLSMNEYNELLTSLQNFGFYTLTYFDSDSFIKDFFENKFKDSKLILFEGSQKGTGRARDAFLPAFCDLEKLVHTGPNAYVNSICTNKYHWTKLLETHNLSVPKSWRFYNGEWLNNEKPITEKKLIAKPCYECASIGIHKQSVAYYSTTYETYLKNISHTYRQPLIVQEFITGYEVEVPVIIHQKKPYILPPVILHKANNLSMEDSFLDFDDIYDDDYQFSLLESINNSWNSTIQKEVFKVIELLELERYTRIDFRITADGMAYITDINSYPHIVKHSSFAFAFEQLHISSQNILPCLIGNVLMEAL